MAQIRVNDLTFCYDGSWDNVFTHLSFSVDTDWRLGLVGRNGRGKTTLLRLLAGELDAGSALHSPVHFSLFPFSIADEDALCGDIAAELSGGAPQWKLLRSLPPGEPFLPPEHRALRSPGRDPPDGCRRTWHRHWA